MDVSCYTVRPGPDSGWLTFFELARTGRAAGFFLVLGPAECGPSGPDPDQRRVAQETARMIVAAAKARHDPDIAGWIAEVGRRVAEAPAGLEFGAMVAGEDSLHFDVEGRVRVVPVTAGARRRWEREIPRPGELAVRRVEPGDRFFLGRVPREAAAGLPAADLLEGIERGGGSDGALIVTIHSVRGTGAAIGPAEPAEFRGASGPPVTAAPEQPPTPPAPAVPEQHAVPPRAAPEAAALARPTRPLRHRRPVSRFAWGILIGVAVLCCAYLLWVRPTIVSRARVMPAVEVAAPSPADDASPPAKAAAPSPGEAGLAWATRLPGAVTGAPLPAGGRIVVGCRDGRVYGITPDSGQVAWRLMGQKGFGGGPAFRDSLACIGGFDGLVRAFDPATGRQAWEFGTAGRIMATPVFADGGRVIAASYDHTLYSLDAATGRLAWKTRLGGILWATPALGRKLLYVAGLDGVVAAVNPKWGSIAWRFRAGGEIYSSPAATDSLVVFGCEDGLVYGLDARSGSAAWRAQAGSPVGGGVRAADGLFLVGDDAGVLHAIDAAGRERWSYRAGGAIKSTPLVDEATVVVSSHDGSLHALNLADGRMIGRIPLGSPIASSPVIVGDHLYVGTHEGRVVALRLR